MEGTQTLTVQTPFRFLSLRPSTPLFTRSLSLKNWSGGDPECVLTAPESPLLPYHRYEESVEVPTVRGPVGARPETVFPRL